MANPPTDMTPHALFDELSRMPRPHLTMDFPRRREDGEPIGQIVMRPLSQSEQIRACAEADRYVRRLFGADMPKADQATTGFPVAYSNECAVRILLASVRCAEDAEKQFFPTADAIRAVLTSDEVGALMLNFYEVCRRLGPIITTMTELEVDAWLKKLEQGVASGAGNPFAYLSSDAQSDLAYILGLRTLRLQTDISSVGSQPDELTPEPSPATDGEVR